MSCILYTYSKSLIKELKNHIENEGDYLYSFSYLESFTPETNGICFIDITSLVILLEMPNQTTYNAERFLDKMEPEYRLIVDEHYAKKAENLFPFHISEIEELKLFTVSNEDDPSDDAKKVIKKLFTDLQETKANECISFLFENLIGHPNFKKTIKEELYNFKIFHELNEDKIFSIFIMGSSGVGKTEVGRLFHKFLDSDSKLAKINFGNYSSKDALNSLIGSPRGYIGSDTGELTEKINRSNAGVILIDEFEKADQKVFHFFLELLEDGKFTDTQGIEYDLSGYIIIFTSNLKISEFNKHIFPELQSRFSLIYEFEQLSNDEKQLFISKRVEGLVKNYNHIFKKTIQIANPQELLKVDVNNFDNIRELNMEIRRKFLEYCKQV